MAAFSVVQWVLSLAAAIPSLIILAGAVYYLRHHRGADGVLLLIGSLAGIMVPFAQVLTMFVASGRGVHTSAIWTLVSVVVGLAQFIPALGTIGLAILLWRMSRPETSASPPEPTQEDVP